MRILVTGGAGFIGSHVAQALLDAGHEVRVLDRLPTEHVPPGAELIKGDVRDRTACQDALAGIDAVCHQAAMVGLGVDLQDLPGYVGDNDLGTAVLLAAMAEARVDTLVLASSMVVYGEGAYQCVIHGPVAAAARTVADLELGMFEPGCPSCALPLTSTLVDEDARLDPRNVYAATKAAQEYLAAAWARGTGGTVAALRYHNVYGPRMPRDTPYAGVAALFRSSLLRGEAPRVFEDGGQRRDFVHVRDVATANVAALLASGRPGSLRAFNVGSGVPHSVGEMAQALALACGGPDPVVTGEYRLGDVRHITASSARIRAELGWQPATSFAAGVAELAHEHAGSA